MNGLALIDTNNGTRLLFELQAQRLESDDLEEDIMLETALDHLNPYQIMSAALTSM